jgi:hypothetical protein
MSDNKRKGAWIDPNSKALAYLADKKPAVQEEIKQATDESQSRAVVHNAEVLPPEPKRALLPAPVPGPEIPPPTFTPPADLTRFEHQVRQMADTLDFDIPEGLLDRFFDRKNYRLRVKIERAELICQFESANTARLREQCNIAEALRQLNQIRFQQFLDALRAWQAAEETHYRIALAHERVENERAIDAAKTKAEIAKHAAQVAVYERQIRDAQREPLPAAPPAPGPCLTADEKALMEDFVRLTRRREATHRERMHDVDLRLDEFDAASRFGQETVARAKAEAIKVFKDISMLKGEKQARIEKVLEAFGLDEQILPPAIRELLENANDQEEDMDDDVL